MAIMRQSEGIPTGEKCSCGGEFVWKDCVVPKEYLPGHQIYGPSETELRKICNKCYKRQGSN